MAAGKHSDAAIALDIVERSPSIALRVDGSNGAWRTLFITRNISKFGYAREDFLSGKLGWNDIVHPDDRAGLVEALDRYEKEKTDIYATIYRIVTSSGEDVWVRDDSTVTRDAAGNVLYADCVISDHTQVVESMATIEDNLRQQRVMNDILQALHAAELDEAFQIILDRTGQYLDISRVILFEDNADHTGCTAVYEWDNAGISSMMGKGPFTLEYTRDIPDIEGDLIEEGMRVVNYGDIPPESVDEFDNEGVIAAAMFSVYQAGERYGFICFDECVKQRQWKDDTLAFLKNISKLVSTALVRKNNEEAIRRIAYHDQLTGLFNRFRFDHFLNIAIREAKQNDEQGFVLFIDLDDFKIINDGYGHDYGDALLIGVADFLRANFDEQTRIFRFGGDEFVLLASNIDSAGIQSIIDTILQRARHPWHVMDREFYCTVSIGAVRFPDGSDGVTEVIKNTDIAMYQAKSLGKNNYVYYNRGLDNNSQARLETESRMRAAIENNFDAFTVYYQPMVNTQGEVIGAEALVRWKGEDGQLIPPGEFIPLAEYLGLIVPLGEFVLREAALECRRINEILPNFFISVNVSMRQFQQADFIQRTESILRQSGVNLCNITLEVTEGMVVQDLQHMNEVLEELRTMGMKIAMDDFGTGYSSLNNMRTLPLDIVKIDRTFVQDVTRDAYSKTFVRLICDLCHSMDRIVCVEGVETAEQYRYCADCHVDTIQGFYFHRPMPELELDRLMLAEYAGKGGAV